jgi:hypothetical protein
VSPRVRLVVNGLVTVVILGLVIFGLWAFTAPKNQTTTPSIQLSPSQLSDRAYQDGLAALSKDETGTALAYFQKALDLDPKNTAAQKALADAKKPSATGGSGGSNSSSSPSNPVAPASAWTKTLKLKSLLPTSFPDYIMGNVETGSKTSADISASAAKPTARVTPIVWTVLDEGSTSKASGFLKSTSKRVYSKDAAQVKVNDVTAYFGTRSPIGCVAFTRGRYVFEVLITSTAVAADKNVAVQAAAAFPVSP